MRPPKLHRMIKKYHMEEGQDITGKLGITTLTTHARKGEVEQREGRWYLTADGVKAANLSYEEA